MDSVELLVRFEKYFEVEVPDAVAESICTPGDLAAWVSQHLAIPVGLPATSRETVARRLRDVFAARAPAEITALAELLPDGEAWAHYAAQLANDAGWQLPEIGWLQPPRARGWLNQLFNWMTTVTPPEPNLYRLADLIDWTLARNYQLLLAKPWQSQYDILQAVIGITSEQSGLEISEIRPDSSFVLDLGID